MTGRRKLILLLTGAALALPAAAVGRAQGTNSDGLTAYGATRKAWAAHHLADRSPSLAAGCCFLPRQSDGQDRYYGVGYHLGRVVGYQMHFAPHVSVAVAKRSIRTEFPRDAHFTAQPATQRFEQLDYCSAMVRAATGHKHVQVWLLFAPEGGVEDAIVTAPRRSGC
jgi:hypothetical protein